jgi:hypothetical protein
VAGQIADRTGFPITYLVPLTEQEKEERSCGKRCFFGRC